MMWSDGRERADDYQGDRLASDIAAFFEAAREVERQRLQWENAELHLRLRERAERSMKASA